MTNDRSIDEVVFHVHEGTVYPLKLICSGERPGLVTCGGGGGDGIARWDALSGEMLCAYDGKNRRSINDFVVFGEGGSRSRLLAATDSGIFSWHLYDGSESVGFVSPSTHEFRSLSLGYFSDGTPFVAASCQEGVYLVDPFSGRLLRPLLAFGLGDCTSVSTARVSPGLCLVAAGGDNGYVRIWNAETLELMHQFQGNFEGIITSMGVSYLSDGSIVLASGDSEGVIHRWNISTGTQFGRSIISGDLITMIAPADFGVDHLLMVSGQDGVVRKWDCLTGDVVDDSIGGISVDAAVDSGDSLLIAVGRRNGDVAVSRSRIGFP